ncbi:MAG: aminoglycoside phosphotransferase family protein [Acidimicrobiaceae bacterium]|nr:aminoglycoside phosphotransferase family protein [Acidimicrobiaceae bacterium]
MNEVDDSYVLDPATIGAYLASHGVVAEASVSAVVLGGGVSNDVVLVKAGADEFVVKQALPRLRVAEEWLAPRERIATEAVALRWARVVAPDAVPEVVYLSSEDYLLVMAAAPATRRVWKSDLLRGTVDPGTGCKLGELLGSWHGASLGDAHMLGPFVDLEPFERLRIEPYYRTVARRHPDLAPRIIELATRLLTTRRCLVHGDFSPKNILIDGEGISVIDWEVAHFGDPVFDLAFMLCHLRCKAAFRPESAGDYRQLASAFLESYDAATHGLLETVDEGDLVAQSACLLLARVDGKSPVEYLDDSARSECRLLARELIARRDASFGELWSR